MLPGARTRDYYGWGQPVHAAFDGQVVAAVDGVAERARVQVVREVALALRNTARFASTQGGAELVAGNHVIVRGAEAFALFAHLAPGTVAVALGQRVRAGELIGRVGHTGNSTAPHLHFQLMDAADPLDHDPGLARNWSAEGHRGGYRDGGHRDKRRR